MQNRELYVSKTPLPDSLADIDLTVYYRTISAKGKDVMRKKRAEGETMHLAPLGWLNARNALGRSIILPDPERYELVQEAKRLRHDGISIRKTCGVVEQKGLRSQRGEVVSPIAMWKAIT